MESDGAYVTYTPTGGADTVTKKLGDESWENDGYFYLDPGAMFWIPTNGLKYLTITNGRSSETNHAGNVYGCQDTDSTETFIRFLQYEKTSTHDVSAYKYIRIAGGNGTYTEGYYRFHDE